MIIKNSKIYLSDKLKDFLVLRLCNWILRNVKRVKILETSQQWLHSVYINLFNLTSTERKLQCKSFLRIKFFYVWVWSGVWWWSEAVWRYLSTEPFELNSNGNGIMINFSSHEIPSDKLWRMKKRKKFFLILSFGKDFFLVAPTLCVGKWLDNNFSVFPKEFKTWEAEFVILIYI